MASRLTELQNRFKQKQLHEKEDKLNRLLVNQEKRSVSIAISKSKSERVTDGGNFRQTFEERKQKAGIDRSYPLKPLKVNATVSTRNVQSIRSIPGKGSILKSNSTLIKKSVLPNAGCENVTNEKKLATLSKTANLVVSKENKKELMVLNGIDKNGNSSNTRDGKEKSDTTLEARELEKKPLKGVAGQSPDVQRITPKVSGKESFSLSMSAARNKNSPRAPTTNRPSARQNPRGPPSAVTRDDLVSCKYCNRRFASDRLQIHEDICARTGKKKRKTYDATKHRVQGTELEPFVKRNVKPPTKTSRTSSAKKSNWRQTHEDFISTIRAAKMTQAHIAKGGKLSDLPPPPPSANVDYVQCPHCGRRFNETAAERHIPKCASYEFNKPKGAQKPVSKSRTMR